MKNAKLEKSSMKLKRVAILIVGVIGAIVFYRLFIYESGESLYRRGERQPAEAAKWYLKAAERGYVPAQYAIGCCYVHGDKVDEGIKWLRKAAEQGNADAQNTLGIWYHLGYYGIKRDLDEAVKWYSKAAEQGHSYAKNQLASLSEYIKYSKTAKEGDVKAMYTLGDGFSTGWGWGDQGSNYPEMLKWFRKAAEQGYAPSQYNLGYCYANGKGVDKDPVEAVKWFSKAAEQGNDEAQYWLGNLYSTCDAVGKNDAEAVKWYSKAAEQGNKGAQGKLAEFYRSGRGVEKDENIAQHLTHISSYENVKWSKDSKPVNEAITKEAVEKNLSSKERKYIDTISPEERQEYLNRKKEEMCRRAGVVFKPDLLIPDKQAISSKSIEDKSNTKTR